MSRKLQRPVNCASFIISSGVFTRRTPQIENNKTISWQSCISCRKKHLLSLFHRGLPRVSFQVDKTQIHDSEERSGFNWGLPRATIFCSCFTGACPVQPSFALVSPGERKKGVSQRIQERKNVPKITLLLTTWASVPLWEINKKRIISWPSPFITRKFCKSFLIFSLTEFWMTAIL